MLAAFELYVTLVFSAFVGYVVGSGNLHAFDFPDVGKTARHKRRIIKLKGKQRWEIKAGAYGIALAVFFFFRFHYATDFSHFPWFIYLIIMLSTGLMLGLAVPALAVYLTRCFRNIFFKQPE